MLDDNCIQTIIDKYFQQTNILTSHQIESYDDYLDNIYPMILSQFFPLVLEYPDNSKIKKISLDIKDLSIESPYYTENNGCSKIMTPYIARLRNFTYSLTLLSTVVITLEIRENNEIIQLPQKEIPNVIITKIPIIVKSKYCTSKNGIGSECHLDSGGYFIINGNEKVLISQEKIAPNIILTHPISKNSSKYSFVSEVRSSNDKTYGINKTISIKITNKSNIFDNKLYITLPHIKQDIPVFIVFRALGCLTDKEMIYFIIDNNQSEIDDTMIKILYKSLLEAEPYRTEQDCLKYISRHLNNTNSTFSIEMKMNYCFNIIQKEFLPHLSNNLSKLYFTGLMINKLIKCYLGIEKVSDRDSYYNKRIETSGILFGNLTIQGMSKIVKDMKTFINKEINTGV